MEAAQRVHRYKTAIGRPTVSRPMKLALSDGILTEGVRLFDYGCGRGDDLRILLAVGISGSGWDPVHRPDAPFQAAEVVNLGYVVNVIENPSERQETLRRAWSLTEKVLIVSGRLSAEAPIVGGAKGFADGYLTSRGTFQKFFEQNELRQWIEQTLQTTALPAGPGVFYVFRDDEQRSVFAASRYRGRIQLPTLARPLELFERNKQLLEPLVNFLAAHGRAPAEDELTNFTEVSNTFGSLKRACRVVEKATDPSQWERIAQDRAQDLLIYLALTRFDRRPAYASLPRSMQLDLKSFFSSFTRACREADELLFSIGKAEVIDGACTESPVGKCTQEALYVHESARDQLPPVLRLFEGCARGYVGRVDGANIIKLNRTEPKVSYLSYPDFETDPHPSLAASLSVNLQSFKIKSRDYTTYQNPPILHRKETFLDPAHPLYCKFARLTRLEEKNGLYYNSTHIGTRDGWNAILGEKRLRLHGHQLVRDRLHNSPRENERTT